MRRPMEIATELSKASILSNSFVATSLKVLQNVVKTARYFHSCGFWIFSTMAFFLVVRNLAGGGSHFSIEQAQSMRTYSWSLKKISWNINPAPLRTESSSWSRRTITSSTNKILQIIKKCLKCSYNLLIIIMHLERLVEHTNQTISIAGHWGVGKAAYLINWSDLELDLEKPTLDTTKWESTRLPTYWCLKEIWADIPKWNTTWENLIAILKKISDYVCGGEGVFHFSGHVCKPDKVFLCICFLSWNQTDFPQYLVDIIPCLC